MYESHILDKLILAGGPPRSGTTLLARLLNSHPEIVTVIDNSVYENWSLYYYQSRIGLVQQLRSGEMSPDEIKQYLLKHIIKDNHVWGAAPSPKISHYPTVAPPVRPYSNTAKHSLADRIKLVPGKIARGLSSIQNPFIKQKSLTRHRIPLEFFAKDIHLCLKSPEIVFALSRLSAALPGAKFLLVHRPVIEIAESMYRKGFEWQLASYHKRWNLEKNKNCELLAPPGVPDEWHPLWKTVTDFQRCVIYAASYFRAMVLEIPHAPPKNIFVYNHKRLCADPSATLVYIAKFLDVDSDGFQHAIKTVRYTPPVIANELKDEYYKIAPQLGLDNLTLKNDVD